MKRHLICAVLFMTIALGAWSPDFVQEAQANSKVRKATSLYLRGMTQYRKKRYGSAISSFRRAAGLLPRHPHFHCHRTRFYTYIGRAYEKKRSVRGAMNAYKKAKRTGCGSRATKRHAIRRYASLYRRWVCSIRIYTRPKGARVYLVTKRSDKLIGKTPLKRVMQPGKYNFKVRQFDHKTYTFKVKLRPGRHIKKNIKLQKGDDPIQRTEKPGIEPPPTMNTIIAAKKPAKPKKKKKEEKDPIVILDDK